jgi:hypothetical protein
MDLVHLSGGLLVKAIQDFMLLAFATKLFFVALI